MLHSAPYARYQRVHGKRVLLLSPIPEGFERGFRNRVDVGDLAALRRSDARYALVHRNLNAELPGRTSAPLARFTVHAQACRSALRNALGPPVHSDDLLEVFDLRAAAR